MLEKTITIKNKVIKIGSNFVFIENQDLDKVICEALEMKEDDKKELLGCIEITIKETTHGITVDGVKSDVLERLNKDCPF